MAVGFSRDMWYNYIADRSHPAVASAVVEIPEWDPTHVYAWKPANNYKGWKLIDRGEAGVDDASVIKEAYNSINEFDTLILKGTFNITETITIDKRIFLRTYGKLIPKTSPAFLIGHPGEDKEADKEAYGYDLHFGIIEDKTRSYDAIHCQRMIQSVIRFTRILAKRGIYTNNSPHFSDNIIEGASIVHGDKGIEMYGDSGKLQEGNTFNITFIAGEDIGTHGIYIHGAGNLSFNRFICDLDFNTQYDIEETAEGVRKNIFICGFVREDYIKVASSSLLLETRNYGGSLYIKDWVNNNGVLVGNAGHLEIWRSSGRPYIDFKDDEAADYDARIIKDANHGLRFDVGGSGAIKTSLYCEPSGHVNATFYGIRTKTMVADYGGDFANFTPPTGKEGLMIIAIDTNATSPGKRLYVYANGQWNYVDLT